MARIMVVEDEADLRQVLEYNLRDAGHEVVAFSEGRRAITHAQEELVDLVLLDLMLPDISGLEVCRALKGSPKTREVPVVMVTARGEEIDRVVGFELGADDYVVKPFSVRELLLRLRAVLRRGTLPAEEPPGGALAPIRFGRLTLDTGAHRVWVDGQEVALTPLEFKLVCTLHERRNRVQSRSALLDDVWGASQENITRTIDTHIKRLREKLGDVGAYIETVRGVGYRFVGSPPPVENP